jgi:hypothetical protein
MASPPSTPDAATDSVEFHSFSGLKNTVDPESLGPDELQQAVNIDLDDVGQIRRRRGYTKVAAGNFYGLFAGNSGKVYGVRNGNLGIIRADYSFTTLKTGLGSDPATGVAPICYVQVGDQIFYSSPTDSGAVSDSTGVVSPWGADVSPGMWLSPVVNPTASLPAIRGKLLGAPPMATDMDYWNGRIYLANGPTVWATELFLYNFVDKTRGFYQFEDNVTMVGAVGDGVYVGTDGGLWFLSGTHAEGLKRVKVLDSPVIAGSKAYVPAELANPPQVGTMPDTPLMVSITFLTTNGFCVASNGGQAYNLTESKVVFPDAGSAAAFYRRQDGVNQYIAVTNSGGTPSANTRIGDYVDAELIRGGEWGNIGDGVILGEALSATWI